MKLIRCVECGDTFSLSHELKECRCGNVAALYTDNLNAVYHSNSNKYQLLGFSNNSFRNAETKKILDERQDIIKDYGYRFEAFIIPEPCSTFKRLNSDEHEKLIDK